MNTSDSVASLVDSARDAGVVLWLHEGQLRFRCHESARCEAALESLRPRKSAIIEYLRREQTQEESTTRAAPLSFAQERLWFIGRLGVTGEAYHNASAVRIDGAIDCAALARAFVLVARRHESLRTRFVALDAKAVQIVDRPRAWVMAACDVSGLEAVQAEIALRRMADEQAARPFDLEAGHLMRVLLVRRRAGEHLLLVTLHHIISDASSLGILVRDLMTLYAQESLSWPARLPALPLRYRDFARWQHAFREAEVEGEGALDYWRKTLGMVPTFLRLPTSRPRPALADFMGGDVPFQLTRQTTQALKRIAERESATLFMASIALFQTLLYRITAQKEFIVGTLTSGRLWPELEDMIGMFVNTVPLKSAVDEELSYLDVLRMARRTTLEAFAHQSVPFQSIVQMLEPQRDLSRQPLVQVMFMFRNITSPAAAAIPGLTVRTLVPRSQSTQFDLMLNANEEEGALHGQFLYATQLFGRVFGQSLAEGFCSLAEQVVAHPEARISHIPLISTCRPQSLEPCDRLGAIPLSATQDWLWQHGAQPLTDPVCHVIGRTRFTRELELDVLRLVLRHLGVRHEILRARLQKSGGDWTQVIEPLSDCMLREDDLRVFAGETLWSKLSEILVEESHAPFDVLSGGLFRARWIQLKSREHVLQLTAHRLIMDDASMRILIREAVALYEVYSGSSGYPLRELLFQYADVVHWQRGQNAHVLGQAAYWRRALADAPPELALPVDRPRATPPSRRGGVVLFELEGLLARGVKTLAVSAAVEVDDVLCSGYALLLSRLSGQDDFVLGVTVANRPMPELERMVGPFANTSLLRIRVDAACSLSAWIREVRNQKATALVHQGMPLEQVLELVTPVCEDTDARGPGVRVSFESLPTGDTSSQDPGLAETLARFDLALTLEETPDQSFRGRLVYATDLFDRSTVERWARNFATLVSDMAAQPAAQLGRLRLLTQSQRRQLIHEFNTTEVPRPDALCVHEMFEAQVARTPTALAVVYEDRSLTFEELNTRANQLAWYLREHGVGAGERVGLCIDRSPQMLWAMLAVLKAGAGYVPLDPNYPAERLAFMLDDAAPAFVITRSSFVGLLPPRAAIVDLDRVREAISREPDGNPPYDSGSRNGANLAYIIYTSGSTGLPKGVMVTHGGLSNYLCWAVRTYGALESQGAPVSSPLAFDATITSLFVPLLVGRPLLLVREGDEVQGLARMLLSRQMGPVKITPAHLSVLGQQRLESGEKDAPHIFVIGGEALSPATVDLWRALCPGARLFNEYGPTETVVGCCSYDAGEALPGVHSIPIGRPIWNTRVYILDAVLEPVPVGVTGEIYIAGAGVASGYVKRPELTAERFLCDPFSMQAGARMYRSGDLGRWRADGNIEYLGRNDHQVKVRGFRIELGEIEASLSRHPRIQECVVVLREAGKGHKSLVAYYTLRAGAVAASPDPREFLRQSLPEYMVPGAFVRLESVPLTRNGKLDRQRLPEPEAPVSGGMTDDEPRGEVEMALARIWCELLKRSRVGRNDNFFELGGHSLSSALCATRLKAELGLELPLVAFFNGPTLEKLAAACVPAVARGSRTTPRVRASGPTLFLFHPIGGHGLQYRELAQHLTGFGGIHLVQRPELRTGEAVSFRSLDSLGETYAREILGIDPAGPYYLGGWSLGARLAVHVAAVLEARGRAIEFLGLIDGPLSYERPIDFDAQLLDLVDHDVAEAMQGWPAQRQEAVRRAWEQNPASRTLSTVEQAREMDCYFHLFVANAWLGLVSGPPAALVQPRRAQVYGASGTLSGTDAVQTLETTLQSVFARPPPVCSFPGDHYDIIRLPGVKRLAANLSRDAHSDQSDATRIA